MMVSESPKTCVTCKHYTYGYVGNLHECKKFLNVVTGDEGPCSAARSPDGPCKPQGLAWEQRASINAIVNGDYMGGSTVETPMATIHKDPWDKISKTYE